MFTFTNAGTEGSASASVNVYELQQQKQQETLSTLMNRALAQKKMVSCNLFILQAASFQILF